MKLTLSMQTYTWICYAIGYVFITSGVMKLVDSDFRGMFASMGLPFPEATLFLIAIVELGCGMLIAGRLYIRLAVPPLLLIMFGAIYFSKLPTLFNEGALSFAFAARLDIIMIILLLLVWQHVRGKLVL